MADLTALYLASNSNDAKVMAEIAYTRQLADELAKIVDQCEGWTSLSSTLEDMIGELRNTADVDEESCFPSARAKRDSEIEDRHTTGVDTFGEVARLTDFMLGRGAAQ